MSNHVIGLMLGTENDWPTAFEELIRRANLSLKHRGETHAVSAERVAIEPFDLRATTDYEVVIDRLAYWYFHPREWLKKSAMMDEIYLLNNPFTFQSMEKHTAFCGMIRLGVNMPGHVAHPTQAGAGRTSAISVTAQAIQQASSISTFHRQTRSDTRCILKPFDGGGVGRRDASVGDSEEATRSLRRIR